MHMSLQKLITTGIGLCLESPVIKALAGPVWSEALVILENHFLLSTYEIGQAFQDSYGYAMAAVGAGLASEPDNAWERLVGQVKSLFNPKVIQEFSAQIEGRYLQPFARQKQLSQAALRYFRQRAVSQCLELSRRKEALFPPQHFPEVKLVEVLSTALTLDVTALLLEQLRGEASMDTLLSDFLAHDGLLGDAVLFFFREKLRKDQRVERTLAELQREGLWADVRDLKAAVSQLREAIEQRLAEEQRAVIKATEQKDFAHAGELLSKLQALQQRQAESPQLIQAVRTTWENTAGRQICFQNDFGEWGRLVDIRLDEVLDGLGVLEAELKRTREAAEEAAQAAKAAEHKIEAGVLLIRDDIDGLAQKVAAVSETLVNLLSMMRYLQITPQINARDEFTQYNRTNLKLIEQATHELTHISPSSPAYSPVAITVGSVLASAGNLDRAEELFEQARAAANTPEETALASFNLFQARLRRMAYQEALAALQIAIGINPGRYAPHNVEKYPLIDILGAGGMGCAFLCQDFLRGKVVIKSFWEAHKGSPEQLFAEALTMAKIAGEYVPSPVDYDYADPVKRERPFIVMEYTEGAIDGENWLGRHGKLSLTEGLQVGLQVTKGLQIAHRANICHLDLKPGNLLLRRQNSTLRVKMIDFGLANVATSLRQEAARQSPSRGNGASQFARQIFGTLDYAPPEQLGEMRYGAPGPKSDLYALGATLYYLLSGESPRIINPQSLPPSDELYRLLSDCMRQNPEERPASADAVLTRLERMAEKLEGSKREPLAGGIFAGRDKSDSTAESRRPPPKTGSETKSNLSGVEPRPVKLKYGGVGTVFIILALGFLLMWYSSVVFKQSGISFSGSYREEASGALVGATVSTLFLWWYLIRMRRYLSGIAKLLGFIGICTGIFVCAKLALLI
jgi:serine/threonine protein kinase